MAVSDLEVREMAVRYIDAEVARLRALRAELTEKLRPSSARDAAVRKEILAGRANGEKKVHWTQRPENRAKALANARRATRGKKKAQAAAAKEKEETADVH